MADGRYADNLNSKSEKSELFRILREMMHTQAGLGAGSVGLKASTLRVPSYKNNVKCFKAYQTCKRINTGFLSSPTSVRYISGFTDSVSTDFK